MANPLPNPLAANPLQKQRKHGPGRPFQKGQSGYPAGRPLGARNAATQLAEALPELNSAADLAPAISAIARAAADGAITPFDAAELARMVETALRALEIGEFDRRLAATERQIEQADAQPA